MGLAKTSKVHVTYCHSGVGIVQLSFPGTIGEILLPVWELQDQSSVLSVDENRY